MENNNCMQLMARLRMIDFSLYETVLYLDAYPHNREALDYYHKLLAQRKALVTEHEHTAGPLTICGNESTDSWDWIKSPWPWEYDAN